ncbi:hypothetical protein M4J06_001755 [Streptomyces coelicoflavus]|uniref:hypothetical protein n=1 Tax=Streptomyces coelicoflavus TaxID=285562 RepID=UPI00210A17C6|nr:hypothetical protein [Streptomyces coelicoflavus]MCQ4204065.1 hypothetical protein [Streptomyces coelicoflavus]
MVGCAARQRRSSAYGTRPTASSLTLPPASTCPTTSAWPPAHYALYIDARRRDDSLDGHTLLRIGPYTQTRHAQQDCDRITAALDGRETTLVPGHRVSVRFAPFDVSDHRLFTDPYKADAVALLAATIEGATA